MTYELPDEVRQEAAVAAIKGLYAAEGWALPPEENMKIVDAITPILAAHFERIGAEKMREAAAQVVMAEHEPWAIMRIGQPIDMAKVMADSQLQMFGRRAAAIRTLPLPSQATNPTEEA
jgi:hypothetical protein